MVRSLVSSNKTIHMRFRTAIRWARLGITILIVESIIEIVINLIKLTDIFGYLSIFTNFMKMISFLLLYVFFDTIEEKIKYLKDQ